MEKNSFQHNVKFEISEEEKTFVDKSILSGFDRKISFVRAESIIKFLLLKKFKNLTVKIDLNFEFLKNNELFKENYEKKRVMVWYFPRKCIKKQASKKTEKKYIINLESNFARRIQRKKNSKMKELR